MLRSGRGGGWLVVALAVAGGGRVVGARDDPAVGEPDRLAAAQRQHGLDPESPLEGRIRDPIPAVFERIDHFRRVEVSPRVGPEPARPRNFREIRRQLQPKAPRGPEPTPHAVAEAERAQLRAAVATLPPGFRRVLKQRLRAFSFVDHMVVGGTVMVANPGEPESLHDIAISATVFGQTASEWLTQKEQGVFIPGDSPVHVRIEVMPDPPALTYVLLHEAAHLVDIAEQITAPPPPYPPNLRTAFLVSRRHFAPRINPFLAGVWGEDGAIEARYADPRRDLVEFYSANCHVTGDAIPTLYASLAATPFVSLYSTRNPMEDLAEYLTVAHLTEALGHSYRIVLHIEGIEVMAYEPMRSDLVRARLAPLRRFAAAAEPTAGPR